MKNFRIIIPAIVFSLLITTTGCKTINDFFGWGSSEGEIPINTANIDEGVPENWSNPGDAVGSRDSWEPIAGISLPSIYFSYDKYSIGTSEKAKLDQVAKYMQANPKIGLIIEGNCDERGSAEYNRSLGERRALAVKDHLIAIGLQGERMQTISYGEEKPAVTGTGEAVFSKNRRADLVPAKMK